LPRIVAMMLYQWTTIWWSIWTIAQLPVQSFTVPRPGIIHNRNHQQHHRLYAAQPVSPDRVQIFADTNGVSAEVRRIVQAAAETAIAETGRFYLAIPGGSILKMLVGSGVGAAAWTRHTTIAYVNHKCVEMTNLDQSTHAKAMKLFMHQWEGCTPIVLDGTDHGDMEAKAYAKKIVQAQIPTTANMIPVFDLALIGVGDDGHIGSLYPHRNEVLDTVHTVLAVDKKFPPSITLTLPVLQNAKQVVVAACGVSDKYPLGKSAAMRQAIVSESETLQSFPAIGLRDVATWILDEAAARQLGKAYYDSSAKTTSPVW
jgi:6-phosphogluconolactonase